MSPTKHRFKLFLRIFGRARRFNECYLYPTDRPDGYARIRYRGVLWYVHVLVYTVLVGQVPKGKELDHTCKRRNCITPWHLEPVTHLENVGRGNAGKANAAKTHCRKGHAFTRDNTYRKNGRRHCRACHREWSRLANRRG